VELGVGEERILLFWQSHGQDFVETARCIFLDEDVFEGTTIHRLVHICVSSSLPPKKDWEL